MYQKNNKTREAERQRLRRTLPEVKFKHNVRAKTRYKYGPAMDGFEYHHYGDYNKDNWLMVPIDEHKRWENGN